MTPHDGERRWALPLWMVILIGLPLIVTAFSTPRLPDGHAGGHPRYVAIARPAGPLPPVEPLEVLQIAPVEARAINRTVPFSTAPNPAARPFRFAGDDMSRARATDCLAAAQYYEAGDDPSGQEAVAQVVINRMRHPAFPKSICGVVFQGSERRTGCQFTFTCDGALSRIPSPQGWERARKLAESMLAGKVDGRVGLATHYHTDWVVPYWSSSLDKITSVDTHLFFRWKGWWGTPSAFRGEPSGTEPVIARLASLSPGHMPAALPAAAVATPLALPDFSDLAQPALAVGRERIGSRLGQARLIAINSTGDAFAMLLDTSAKPTQIEQLSRQMCSGRTKCRLLAWRRAEDAPADFPVPDEKLGRMSYAYIRATDAGLERSLYNCREFSGQPAQHCMRDRVPVALPSLPPPPPATAPRKGVETLRLTP